MDYGLKVVPSLTTAAIPDSMLLSDLVTSFLWIMHTCMILSMTVYVHQFCLVYICVWVSYHTEITQTFSPALCWCRRL